MAESLKWTQLNQSLPLEPGEAHIMVSQWTEEAANRGFGLVHRINARGYWTV